MYQGQFCTVIWLLPAMRASLYSDSLVTAQLNLLKAQAHNYAHEEKETEWPSRTRHLPLHTTAIGQYSMLQADLDLGALKFSSRTSLHAATLVGTQCPQHKATTDVKMCCICL